MRAWRRHVDDLLAFGVWAPAYDDASSPKSVMYASTRWVAWGRDAPLPWTLRVLVGFVWVACVVAVGRTLDAVSRRLFGVAALLS
jgi:hypothetical protein